MKFTKGVLIGIICLVTVILVVTFVTSFFEGAIVSQSERNYSRFVQNVDGLTNTFRISVEDCAIKEIEIQDRECIKMVEDDYRNQFFSLVKLFGYELYFEELYGYWQADLRYWYDLKKIQIQNIGTEIREDEIKKISEIRTKAVKEKFQPIFLKQLESTK